MHVPPAAAEVPAQARFHTVTADVHASPWVLVAEHASSAFGS